MRLQQIFQLPDPATELRQRLHRTLVTESRHIPADRPASGSILHAD